LSQNLFKQFIIVRLLKKVKTTFYKLSIYVETKKK